VEAVRVAHRLFGDAAEYLAVNVAHREPADADQTPRVDWTAPAGWGTVRRFPPLQDLSERGTPNPFVDTEWAPEESTTDPTADRAAAVAARQADRAGVGASAIGGVGDAADAILTAARAHGVDVIVVGSHDRGWLGRLFHHSVTEDLVRHAPIPVLVAR